MRAAPPFEEAEQSLAGFLARQGAPADLTWVFREDVHWRMRLREGAPPLPVVRLPLPDANRQAAHRLFERARDRGHGVELGALCRLGSRVACYVCAPRDEEDAMALMLSPGGLKLIIHEPLLEAIAMRSRVGFAVSLLRWRFRRGSSWEMVPSRTEISP